METLYQPLQQIGSSMNRIAWLVLFCSLALGAVTAFKAIIGPASSTAVDQEAAGVTEPYEALAKADKLQVTAIQPHEAQTTASAVLGPQSPVSGHLALPASPPVAQPAPFPNIVSRHWHDPYAIDTTLKPTAKYGVTRKTNNNADSDRQKVTTVKPCRSDAVGAVLRSLKLSTDCET